MGEVAPRSPDLGLGWLHFVLSQGLLTLQAPPKQGEGRQAYPLLIGRVIHVDPTGHVRPGEGFRPAMLCAVSKHVTCGCQASCP